MTLHRYNISVSNEKLTRKDSKILLAQFMSNLGTIINSQKINNMALSIKPIADRVVIEPAPAEEKTASGIYIPDTAKEKPQSGTVVAVGTGKVDEPLTVKVGDTVLYGKYSGTELTYEGKEYLIMRESDIYAIL